MRDIFPSIISAFGNKIIRKIECERGEERGKGKATRRFRETAVTNPWSGERRCRIGELF